MTTSPFAFAVTEPYSSTVATSLLELLQVISVSVTSSGSKVTSKDLTSPTVIVIWSSLNWAPFGSIFSSFAMTPYSICPQREHSRFLSPSYSVVASFVISHAPYSCSSPGIVSVSKIKLHIVQRRICSPSFSHSAGVITIHSPALCPVAGISRSSIRFPPIKLYLPSVPFSVQLASLITFQSDSVSPVART